MVMFDGWLYLIILLKSQRFLAQSTNMSNFQDISAILEAGGISYEDSMIEEVCKRMEGKQARKAVISQVVWSLDIALK